MLCRLLSALLQECGDRELLPLMLEAACLSKSKKDMKASGFVRLGKGGEGVVYAGPGAHDGLAIKVCRKMSRCRASSQMRVWSCMGSTTSYVRPPMAAVWESTQGSAGDRGGDSGTLTCVMDRIQASPTSKVTACINFVYLNFCLSQEKRWRYIRLYAAALVCCLSQLHAKRLIYHDLKPDNVMVDGSDLPVICDTGTCMPLPEGSEFLEGPGPGSPGFMAPEVMQAGPYGRASDIWTLGGTVAELCCGLRNNRMPGWDSEQLRQTGKWYNPSLVIEQVHFDPATPPELKSLILEHCLLMDPTQRATAKELMEHPYFAGIDWALVAAGRLFEADTAA